MQLSRLLKFKPLGGCFTASSKPQEELQVGEEGQREGVGREGGRGGESAPQAEVEPDFAPARKSASCCHVCVHVLGGRQHQTFGRLPHIFEVKTSQDVSCLHAVQRQAEALAAQELELAQREADLHNEQDQLRQQRALLQESSSAMDKERAEARDMLKVGAGPFDSLLIMEQRGEDGVDTWWGPRGGTGC